MTKKSGASLSGYIVSIILISVIMLVPGCGGGASQSGGGEPRVKHHVWGPLYASFTEHSGYAMYTYLLFKYEQTDSMEEGKEITDRYRVILDAITGTVDTLGDTSFYPPRETNVFYIPLMQSASGNAPLLERYNFSLSRKYITALSTYYKRKKDISKRLRRNHGPFLVSLVKPLSSYSDGEERLLFADLSHQNKNSIREAVEIYKARLEEKPVDRIERLKSKRLKLADILQDSQECLVLLKVTMKEIRDLLAG